VPISPDDVGHRVVVRRIAGASTFADILGQLESYGPVAALVRRDDGSITTIAIGEIAAAKRVPPRRRRGIDDLELERIAALGWPGLEQRRLGGWLLRAGGGFTGRANSTLPLGEPGVPLATAIEEVHGWYAERGLPASFQLPLPARAELAGHLEDAGWGESHDGLVMTAPASAVVALDAADLPSAHVDTEPTDEWLALYHYRGGDVPEVGRAVLRAGPAPRFLSVRFEGTTAAICRTVVAENWVGITSIEVAPAFRRRGLARHLLREAVSGSAVRSAYLQVSPNNAAGIGLYESVGFTAHHRYVYLRAGLRSAAD
jgi:GNAT superfamily N-acetyltransferase